MKRFDNQPNLQRAVPLQLVFVLCSSCSAAAPNEETTEESASQTDDDSGASVSGSSTEAGADTTGESDSSQAAILACAAHMSIPAVEVPSGAGPYLDTGFRIPNDLPARFVMDTLSPDAGVWPDGFLCYDVTPPQDLETEWWFAANGWLEPDGRIHVYMATQGVDEVIYYGSDETGRDTPGSPMTSAVMFETSALCPELPRVWIPSIAEHPTQADRVCMHHSSDFAEAVFVRVP